MSPLFRRCLNRSTSGRNQIVRAALRNMLSDEALLFFESHSFYMRTEAVANLAHRWDGVNFLFSFSHQRTPPRTSELRGQDALSGDCLSLSPELLFAGSSAIPKSQVGVEDGWLRLVA